MPQTMDPGDFDIHELEKGRIRPLKVTKRERIDPKVLKPLKEGKVKAGERRRKRRVFAALVGNLLLPGIGNVIIKKTYAGVFLLTVNIVMLAVTLSPVSALGFIGYRMGPRLPTAFSYAVLMPGKKVGTLAINPEMAPVVYFALLMALLAWAHLFYLLVQKKQVS